MVHCDCCRRLEQLKNMLVGFGAIVLFVLIVYVHDLKRHSAIDAELDHADQAKRWAAQEYRQAHNLPDTE